MKILIIISMILSVSCVPGGGEGSKSSSSLKDRFANEAPNGKFTGGDYRSGGGGASVESILPPMCQNISGVISNNPDRYRVDSDCKCYDKDNNDRLIDCSTLATISNQIGGTNSEPILIAYTEINGGVEQRANPIKLNSSDNIKIYFESYNTSQCYLNGVPASTSNKNNAVGSESLIAGNEIVKEIYCMGLNGEKTNTKKFVIQTLTSVQSPMSSSSIEVSQPVMSLNGVVNQTGEILKSFPEFTSIYFGHSVSINVSTSNAKFCKLGNRAEQLVDASGNVSFANIKFTSAGPHNIVIKCFNSLNGQVVNKTETFSVYVVSMTTSTSSGSANQQSSGATSQADQSRENPVVSDPDPVEESDANSNPGDSVESEQPSGEQGESVGDVGGQQQEQQEEIVDEEEEPAQEEVGIASACPENVACHEDIQLYVAETNSCYIYQMSFAVLAHCSTGEKIELPTRPSLYIDNNAALTNNVIVAADKTYDFKILSNNANACFYKVFLNADDFNSFGHNLNSIDASWSIFEPNISAKFGFHANNVWMFGFVCQNNSGLSSPLGVTIAVKPTLDLSVETNSGAKNLKFSTVGGSDCRWRGRATGTSSWSTYSEWIVVPGWQTHTYSVYPKNTVTGVARSAAFSGLPPGTSVDVQAECVNTNTQISSGTKSITVVF